MRIAKRLVAFLTVVTAGVTCSFPTDDSDKVFVTIISLDTSFVVRRGEQLELYARMYHASGPDTVEIHNVRFDWSSDNGTIATVAVGGYGSATITGVNSGLVGINARAVAFESARSASFMVRVANPVEIDSIRPETVRYGDTITVFGVGVDSIFFVQLGDATLFDYPIPGLVATRTRDSLGFSTATFWMPPPARSGQILYFGNGVFGLAPDSTRVFPVDLLEPNDTGPRQRSLDVARFPPPLQAVRFFNPALFFEPLKRDVPVGIDWYQFNQTSPRDLTLIVQGEDVRGTFETFLTNDLSYNPPDSGYYIGADAWTIGPESHACHGRGWPHAQAQPESTIVALRGMGAGALHAIAFYSQPGRYGVAVVDGYVTSDPRFPRDDREEDDFCNAADPLPKRVTLPFRDTLTIDNPQDVDWIRFQVPSAQVVRFRSTPLTPGDASDVDLYVLSDTTADPYALFELGSGTKVGSTEDFTVVLAAGQYYLAVVDYEGVPTAYHVCAGAVATACTDLAFPARAAAAGQSARRKAAAPARVPPLRTSRGRIQ